MVPDKRVWSRLVLCAAVALGGLTFSQSVRAQGLIPAGTTLPSSPAAPSPAPVKTLIAPVTQAVKPVVEAPASPPATAASSATPVVQAAQPAAKAPSSAPVTTAAAAAGRWPRWWRPLPRRSRRRSTPVAQAVATPVAKTVAPVAQAVATPVVPVTQAAVAPVAETVAPVVQTVAPVVQTVAKPVVQTVAPVVQTVATPVAQTVAPVVQAVAPVVQTVAKPVVQSVGPVLQATAPVVQAVAKPVAPVVRSVEPVVQTVAKPVVEGSTFVVRTVLAAPVVPSPASIGIVPTRVGTSPMGAAPDLRSRPLSAAQSTAPPAEIAAAGVPTSDPTTIGGAETPAMIRQLARPTSAAATPTAPHGHRIVSMPRGEPSPSTGGLGVVAPLPARPPAHGTFTGSAPSSDGGSPPDRTPLSGLANLLVAFAAAAGTASAGAGNGGGGLLPFAALAAAFALMTPRFGRRLRLELAAWPSSALALSLERPG